ncbi:hypothetical protein H8E88_21855 [candidate division KSB1 bacterium]|nr:hypothetical protein [candidate division KSB1 bacterium]
MKVDPNYKKLSRFAQWLLRKLFPEDHWDTAVGDFEEVCSAITRKSNIFSAGLWCWGQVINLVAYRIKNSIYWRKKMLKNYLKIALRVSPQSIFC